jgi:hypothetical protein
MQIGSGRLSQRYKQLSTRTRSIVDSMQQRPRWTYTPTPFDSADRGGTHNSGH